MEILLQILKWTVRYKCDHSMAVVQARYNHSTLQSSLKVYEPHRNEFFINNLYLLMIGVPIINL